MYYILIDNSTNTSAGKRNLYELANTLIEYGNEVSLLVFDEFEHPIYNSKANYINYTNVTFTKDDTVIIPDFLAMYANKFFWGKAKLIDWVQNTFLLHYNNPNLEAFNEFWTVDNYTTDYINMLFPNKPIKKITNYITGEFTYNPNKVKLLSFMPRKGLETLGFVIPAVIPYMTSWNICPIENASTQDVADILKQSAIYISPSMYEGNPTPVLESLACGCRVIGYDGWTNEFHVRYIDKVPDNDIIAFHKTLKSVIIEYTLNYDKFMNNRQEASDYVINKYCLDNFKSSIKEAIK